MITIRQPRATDVPRSCRGVTMIEVLISMGVIAILAAILLPAVQSSREAARRTECLSHLRQLAVATEAFLTVHGNYPGIQRYSPRSGAKSIPPGPLSQPQPRESIHARLLPYLEQHELYNKLDRLNQGEELGEPPSSQKNAFALDTHIAVFVCPSDDVPAGGNSYRGCLGPTTGIHGTWKKGWPLAGTIDMEGISGIFQADAHTPQHVRDGLSRTILFSERVVGDRDPNSYTPFRDLAGLDGRDFYRPNDAVVGCAAFTAPDRHYSYIGTTWLLPHYAHTAYNHVLTPNSRIPDCMDGTLDRFSQGAMTARSLHPGGVNVVFADGAAQFISETIDLKVWRALGSISGEETYDGF